MIAFFLISASHKATKGHFELLFHISLSSLVSLLLHGNDFIFIGSGYPHRTHRFSGVPPPGPAIPEVATAQSVFSVFIAPFTISVTVSRLTAPCFSNVSADTCSKDIFISLEYATIPPLKYSELPGTEVIKAEIPPPVQLSAVERDNFFAFSNSPTFLPASYLIIYIILKSHANKQVLPSDKNPYPYT